MNDQLKVAFIRNPEFKEYNFDGTLAKVYAVVTLPCNNGCASGVTFRFAAGEVQKSGGYKPFTTPLTDDANRELITPGFGGQGAVLMSCYQCGTCLILLPDVANNAAQQLGSRIPDLETVKKLIGFKA